MRKLLAGSVLVMMALVGTLGASARSASALVVSSSYMHSGEYTLLRQGAQELGLSDAQYQKTSVAAVGFIFGISGVTNMPLNPPGPGNHTISSNHTTSDLVILDRVANIMHLSRSQAQKVCALFIAYLLALS